MPLNNNISNYLRQQKLLKESAAKNAEYHKKIFNGNDIYQSKEIQVIFSEIDKQKNSNSNSNQNNMLNQNEYYSNSYGFTNKHNDFSGVKIIGTNNYSSNQSRVTYCESDSDYTYSVTVL